jgi:hypothetical protein
MGHRLPRRDPRGRATTLPPGAGPPNARSARDAARGYSVTGQEVTSFRLQYRF